MKYIAIITLLSLLSGCVSTKNVALTGERINSFDNTRLTVSKRPVPTFGDFKPSNAMFGAVGSIASMMSGNEIIKKNNIIDPAIWIRSELKADLASKSGLTIVDGIDLEIDTSSSKKIAETYAGTADVLLDIQTVNWSCGYFPLNWNRYRVMYSVKLRLIDLKTRENIAEGFFAWQTPDDYPKPTYEELFENGARELTKQLSIAKEAATYYFRKEILNL